MESAVGTVERRQEAVVRSALWAAAGDALGWMTELSRGTSNVLFRTGSEEVKETVDWQRNLSSRGPRVDLPAGTYSDDTQLRLAVSRSIRGDGYFDVETFAKVELPVWPAYALGGGLGTKAAAVNLSRRSVNWFSNFFESSNQKYVSGGGNGAAMRIQPHVWSCKRLTDEMMLNVIRDALVTHGHPHGFCGAMFHARCLAHTISHLSLPTASEWSAFVQDFSKIEFLIEHDPQLSAFWKAAWENSAGQTVSAAIEKMQHDAFEDVEKVHKVLSQPSYDEQYRDILKSLGCLTSAYRGSGFKTALAAAALALLHDDKPVEQALVAAANELESDTDTIATMAGALLGAVSDAEPVWAIQDREYIKDEACRLAKIAEGEAQSSFSYPDLGRWNPPAKQVGAVGFVETSFAIAGLGVLEPVGQEYTAGDAVWQWFSLPFGQSILAKRSATRVDTLDTSQLPGQPNKPKNRNTNVTAENEPGQASLPLKERGSQTRRTSSSDEKASDVRVDSIDVLTDRVIQSDFDDRVLGSALNQCIAQYQTVEAVIAFSSIIAKARITRERRRR